MRNFIALKGLSMGFILTNIWMLQKIIPGFWDHYTAAVLAFLTGDLKNWLYYSEIVFPRVAKCTYESYGPSGSKQKFDAFCLLPLNIMNQKLFVILWIWYIIQVVISFLNLIYWVILLYSRKARIYILYRKTMENVSYQLLLDASHKAHFGHFFILYQIAKNTNHTTFIELISELAIQNSNANELI